MGLADEVCAKLLDLEAKEQVYRERVFELERENAELKAKIALAREYAQDVRKVLGDGDYSGAV